jgi:hypothetical protein
LRGGDLTDEYTPVGQSAQLPNAPSADLRLPAVRDYEQAEAEIRATLHPIGAIAEGKEIIPPRTRV